MLSISGMLLLSILPLRSETAAPPAPSDAVAEAQPAVKQEGRQDPVVALDSVLSSIKTVDGDIAVLSKTEKNANPAEKEAILEEIKTLNARREVLKKDFESIATGIDPREYDQATSIEFVLADEMNNVLRPIIGEIKALTEKPREIEQFRTELETWKKRYNTTGDALQNLETIPPMEDKALAEEINTTRKKWSERRSLAENRIQAISYQLEQAESNQPSLFLAVRDGIRSFFRSRGTNFLLCLLGFFGVFFALRFFHQRLNRFTPWMRKGKRPFYVRLIDVGMQLFSLVGAIVAALLILYATGDWVLMGLSIILIIGIILAAKNSLPMFYENARILLNLGEVREGERVVYNGIPWRIERLSVYSVLINEQLRGGELRLPVRQISSLISRPLSDEGEIWFPCSEGDWIIVGDHGVSRVIAQTPEYVQIIKLGGARITIPTLDFLASSPKNLSRNFRVSTTFGIDYKHQAECTTTIPQIMQVHLTKEIGNFIGDHDLLKSLRVEFAMAGASSLDYFIIADFDGSLASRYEALGRALQRFSVDCCNRNGWEIPFTQITLHQATPAD
jgi:hypothetical protein